MEGPKFVSDHLTRNGSVDFIAVSQEASDETLLLARMADNSGHSVIQIPAEIFSCISNTGTPQGIVAICPIPDHSVSDLFTGKTVLILDKVADPGNAGTAVRSAAAFGCSGVVFLKGSAFPWSPKVTRSAAGLNSSIPICEVNDLAAIRKLFPNYLILGAESTGSQMDDLLQTINQPVCLVTGSEAHGLSEVSATALDGKISIPMAAGVESLNAGVSASILLSGLFRKSS